MNTSEELLTVGLAEQWAYGFYFKFNVSSMKINVLSILIGSVEY